MKHDLLKPNRFLIATNSLTGTFFENSIVFLLDHTPESSYGLVINKNISIPYDEVMLAATGCHANHSFLHGGPVDEERLHSLRNANTEEQHEFELESIFNPDHQRPSPTERLFLGYSGWSAGQLQKELDDKCWQVAEADIKSIFRGLLNHHVYQPDEFHPFVISGEDFVP